MADERRRREGLGYELPPEDLDRDYDLVDFYLSYNFAEAALICDILYDNDIDCYLQKLEPSQFPLSIGKHGQIRIRVAQNAVEHATEVLQEAIDAEALTRDGHFVTEQDLM
jgi:hypothetical protein